MRNPMRVFAIPLVALFFFSPVCPGADWPTYRYDAQRTASSPSSLPAKLTPVWRVKFPQHQPAFPNEPRQRFDESYEPVCADGTLVVGSPVDGSVRAFDAASGTRLWVYYTEGPVRLAPVLHDGKVLFGSDDGVFRCLNLGDGRLLWSLRGFPAERPDLRLLGNNRLISMWPVRGGPVVADNVVYFASGVWPTLGVYVYAVDIATGKTVWLNPRLAYMDKVRIDHNSLFDAGASPQGYLLATSDRLIVPNGRSQPVALNRNDGTLFHFVQGYRNGDCRVALGGEYAFVGEKGVLSLIDFREVGSKWLAEGENAPSQFDSRRFDQFEGPYHPYKRFPGCDATSVFEGDTAYSLVKGVFYAHDLARGAVSEYEQVQGGRTLKPLRWDVPMTLRVVLGTGGDNRLFLKAGNRLYGRAGTRVLAIELTGADPPARLAWETDLSSRPTAMIAAAERLFVALEDGTLIAFGASGPERTPETAERAFAPPESQTPGVDSFLETVGKQDGICVALGGLTPAEANALLARTRLRVMAVASEAQEVNALRELHRVQGTYGTRFEAFVSAPLDFGLPPYLGSIVWIRGKTTGVPRGDRLRRLWRAVHPYGGVLCFTGTLEQCAEFARTARAAKLFGAEFAKTDPGSVRITRPGGPEGAADWTHETGDPARSYFSRDEAVRLPLAPLWFGDGPGYGFIKRKDYGRGVKPQVVAGRVFALQQFSRTLFAYDAYTGRVLWQQRDSDQAKAFITRFVSRPEGIYAVGKGVCVVYDPATGRELRRLDYRQAMGEQTGSARAAGIVVTDHSVLIAGARADTAAIEGGLWDADVLICLDRRTGKVRWRREAEERFNTKALAAGGGRVFCTDSMSPLANDFWKRRGAGMTETLATVLALDETTGTVNWKYRYSGPYRQQGAGGWLHVRSRDDWLAYSAETDRVLVGRERNARLLGGRDGILIWDLPLGLSQPVVLMGERILDQGARVIDLETGKVLRSGLFQRGGCNYATANPNLAFLRDKTICYVDLATGKAYRLRNMRSGCSASIVAASGILSIPNFAQGCVCNYPVQTTSAWVHLPAAENWAPTEPVALVSLPTGPEFPRISAEEAQGMHAFKRRFLVEDGDAAAQRLVGRWTFDASDPKDPAVVPDLSGRGAHCKLTNPAFEPRGKGRALRCGSIEAKTFGRAMIEPPEPIADAVTMAARVKLGESQHKGAAGVFERPQYYRLMVDNTKPPYSISFSLQTDDGSWRSVRTRPVVEPGKWVHVAGTFDGEAGELRIYLDGEPVGTTLSAPCRIRPVSGRIDIGVRDTGAFLNGALDDVRIYDRCLGEALIRQLAKTDD